MSCVSVSLLALLMLQGEAPAAASDGLSARSGQQIDGLAGRHAPVLVFHSEEEFFPTSPLFQLETALEPGRDGGGQESDQGLTAVSRATAVRLLGGAEQRRDAYLALTPEEKERLATVYYRVNELPDSVVVEYWLYYVWNEYRARPEIFPFSFDSSHPNDLEHVHVILRRNGAQPLDGDRFASDGLRVESVYISAHEGIAPVNRHRTVQGDADRALEILVERGSHAGGADVDGDGIFTAGTDGESGYKMLWGVRDRAPTWSWYRSGYMDRRDGSAVRFCSASSPPTRGCPRGSSRYRLVPVEELYRQFDRLDLSSSELEHAFESDVGIFKRMFGRSNGQAEKLLLPAAVKPGQPTVAMDGFSSTETGLMFGASTITSSPGFFFGGRLSFLHGAKWFPDVSLQVDPVVTLEGETFFSSALLLSWPLGAVTKVLGGYGVVTDFDERQWDWIGGLEFKIGDFRVSFTGRTMGVVTNSAMDLRLYYFFR